MAEITSALTASGYKSLCVYNDRLELLGRIESWLSLVWPERYNVYSNVQWAVAYTHLDVDKRQTPPCSTS